MSGYEVEHNIDPSKEPKAPESKRPDLSSFHSLKKETIGDVPTNNPHSEPTEGDLTALLRMAADIYERIGNAIGGNGGILQNMIDQLDFDATNPSKRDGGMSQSYISDLDRVDKKKLKDDDTCPICTERFLDDPYPLVVRLPCHGGHKYDLQCIEPWLTNESTCPLDREELKKKKEPLPKIEDDEEDYDDYFA